MLHITGSQGVGHDRVPEQNINKPAFSLCKHNSSVQFGLVAQLSLTLCDPMNFSMPGLPVHYQLPESTQTHVH